MNNCRPTVSITARHDRPQNRPPLQFSPTPPTLIIVTTPAEFCAGKLAKLGVEVPPTLLALADEVIE